MRHYTRTYYSATASPGQIIRQGQEYLQFFSASDDQPIHRTLSIARTKNLNGTWVIDREPILPPSEQVENSSLYFERTSNTWFLFTNHVGIVHRVARRITCAPFGKVQRKPWKGRSRNLPANTPHVANDRIRRRI